MAYTDKQKIEIYNDALNNIKEKNLFFVDDVVALMPIRNKTFYEWWPIESKESNTIKDLLDTNKINEKVLLRESFRKGNSSAERLALYKLICTDVERKSLSMNHVDVTSKDKSIASTIIVQDQETKEELNKLINGDD